MSTPQAMPASIWPSAILLATRIAASSPVPQVFHTNEGHAGFLGLERISDLIAGGLSFDEALQVVRAGTVFTTHTPVPAGIDRFDLPLIERYFSTELLPGVDVADVTALGAEDYTGGDPAFFNMAVMGLRLCGIVAAPRFGVHQDCLYHRFQITANAGSVVVEHAHHPAHILRAGIAGHQVLNKLFRDKRSNVGVIENVLQGCG